MNAEASPPHDTRDTSGNPDPSRIVSFLSHHPLFESLSRDDRERVAKTVGVRCVPAGESVLVEGGPPGGHLFVVVEGSMEVLAGGLVVDVLTSGEVFGAPTLVTGLAPEFSSRAREDSTLYLVPREAAIELLLRPEGVAFVVASLQDRLIHTSRTLRSVADSRSVPVSSLIRRAPVICQPETPIRDVARIMSEEVVAAVLVQTRQGLGIVTDADLRNRVLAAGLSPEAPVSVIMTAPVRTISAERLAPEASIEMMQKGINHLVVVDAAGGVLGIVSAGSLMAPDALSPFAVRWSIMAARREDEVAEAATRLPEVFVSLSDQHLDAPTISRVITLLVDSLTRRLLELAVGRLGRPPVSYAWLALGSAARSELTLVSDQDNALAYADSDDPSVDACFERLGEAVNDGLARCGFAADRSGVLARDPHWRMSRSDWVHVFQQCYDVWDWEHAARACVAFDFRRVDGDLDIVTPLTEVLLRAPDHPSLLNRLARSVVDIRSPLGFRQRLPDRVDIKKSALLPIENIARYYALANRITVSATLDRLTAVGELGVLEAGTVNALQEAYRALAHLRLRHHADAIREGRRLDDTIDTATLQPLARAQVHEALRLIATAQKRVPLYVT